MKKRTVHLLVCLAMCLSWLAAYLPVAAQPMSRYFPQTGHYVSGSFLSFFDAHGGLAMFGYPLTDEFLEGGMTVQYFERYRMEWHPASPDPYKVQLGLLGYNVHGPADPPVSAPWWQPGVRYFPETGHTVKGLFLSYFDTRGSLTMFGYPITEEYDVGGGVIIQYFQRARMERHPADPHRVRLGNLGREWLTRQPQWPYTPQPTERSRHFPETGQAVKGVFLDFFENHGGVTIFGYPISGEFEQGGFTVQYFQRARFEWHPGNPVGQQVQLGLLGTEVHGFAEPPVPDWTTPWSGSHRYFSMTGHVVSNAFLRFFDEHGGVEIFGYPISEAQLDGGIIGQWFQRARMEWRGNRVQLVNLGETIYGGLGRTGYEPDHAFGKVWRDNPKVRDGLGRALTLELPTWAAEENFEGGIMYLRQDTRKVYALHAWGTWEAYDDTWDASQPEKWGYSPPAGRYEPVRGLGKVWRERLGGPWAGTFGWATEPEHGFNGLAQEFEKGVMLWSDRKWVYVLYACGTWEKYEDMTN